MRAGLGEAEVEGSAWLGRGVRSRWSWGLPGVGLRAGKPRPGEGKGAILPRPSAPRPSFGKGHGKDGQMHRELQGTRILRSSRATTPHRQTVIIINVFSLNYMMCVEGGSREGRKKTDRQRKRHTGRCGWKRPTR